MYLLYNIARYSVDVNGDTHRLEIGQTREPVAYEEAARIAAENARSDSTDYGRRVDFRPKGTTLDSR
jgi:hypothetical protein